MATKAEVSLAEAKKRGVIYIARVPPYMKPEKVRHLMSKMGEVGRLFLLKEDEKQRKRRKALGGNRKEKYVEGWVEFVDKRVARSVAEAMNNQPVDEKGRGFFAADLWSLKYLPGFKWFHLMERFTHEKKIKAHRLRTELNQAKKETEFFVAQAEKAKQLDRIEARKVAEGEAAGSAAAARAAVDTERSKVRRKFQQTKPLQRDARNADAMQASTAALSRAAKGKKRNRQTAGVAAAAGGSGKKGRPAVGEEA